MLKSAFAMGLVAATLAFAPVQAQTMSCTDADMMKMQGSMDKMTDATKKEMGMKEMAMAKESMAKKDEVGCMTHMKNMESMMPKG